MENKFLVCSIGMKHEPNYILHLESPSFLAKFTKINHDGGIVDFKFDIIQWFDNDYVVNASEIAKLSNEMGQFLYNS